MPLLVRRVKCVCDLAREGQRRRDRKWSASQLSRERIALDQLHDDRPQIVAVLDGVNRGDVWMIEGGEQPRLALEPGDVFGVAGEETRQNLDRNIAPEPGVPRPVDLAHSSGADSSLKVIDADVSANHFRRGAVADQPCGRRHRGFREKAVRPRLGQQRLHFPTECLVAGAGFGKK
jgi:hypothetical protein